MGTLVWRDDWLLGIEPLDQDHREMVRLVNAVLCADPGADATAQGASQAAAQASPIGVRMQALIDHLRDHFAREESFLEAIDYPDSAEHRAQHAIELADLITLARVLSERGAACIDQDGAEGIKRWFFDHVIAEDRRYARYYHEGLGAGDANG